MIVYCQASIARRKSLPCSAIESGGLQCERFDPYAEDGHWISNHTILHSVAGNGHDCGSIDRYIERSA